MSIESRAALPSCVQLEGLVLLKILRHCEGSLGRTGVMQGICMEGNVLEVTHCFGEPVKEESFEEADEAFQKQKMEALKDLNVDNNTVGWFASVDLSLWMPKSTIDSQYNYQKSIPDSIFLAYDPTRTAQGRIVLRAFRLTQSFMNFYSTNPSFVPSHSGFAKHKISSHEIWEELPVKVRNSFLVHAFLYELRNSKSFSTKFDRLSLGSFSSTSKMLNIASDVVEDFAQEQTKFKKYLRELKDPMFYRRKGEQGEDLTAKKIAEIGQMSRLDRFIYTGQLQSLTADIVEQATSSFEKVLATSSVHGVAAPAVAAAAAAAAPASA